MPSKSIDAGQIKSELVLDGKKFTSTLTAAGKGSKKFTKNQKKNAGIVNKAWKSGLAPLLTIVATGAVFKALIRNGAALEKELASVSTLGDFTAKSMAAMKEEVKDLSSELRQAPVDVARGLYQAISAGAEAGAEATNVLKESIKLGIAGLADTETSVNAVTNAINIFGKENLSAAKAANIMAKVVFRGKTTVGEFGPLIGKAAGFAKELGVSFEEVAAGAALLTRTMPTPQAMTALEGAFRGLTQASAKFEKAGVDIFKVLREEELGGALKIFQELTNGNIKEMKAFIPEMESLNGILKLLKNNGQDYNDLLVDMKDKTDVVNKAVSKQMGTTTSTTAGLATAFGELAESIFTKIQPAYNAFLAVSTKVLDVANDTIKAVGAIDLPPEFKELLDIARLARDEGFMSEKAFQEEKARLIEMADIKKDLAEAGVSEKGKQKDEEAKLIAERDQLQADLAKREIDIRRRAQIAAKKIFMESVEDLRLAREQEIVIAEIAADRALSASIKVADADVSFAESRVKFLEQQMSLEDQAIANEIANEEKRIAIQDKRIAKQDEEADKVIKGTTKQAKAMEDFNQGIWDSLGAGWAESTAGFLAQSKGWKEDTERLKQIMDGVWDDLKKKAITTMIELVGKQLIQAGIAAVGWAPAAALSATATGGGSAAAAENSLGSLFSFVNSFLPSRREGGPVMEGPVMVHDNEFVLNSMQTSQLSSLLTSLNTKLDNLGPDSGGTVVVKASEGSSPLVRLLMEEMNFEVEENNVRSIASAVA